MHPESHASAPASHGHVHHDHKADARAAFMGLIFGAFALLGICYGIVKLTQAKYAGHAPAAGAQH